MAQNLNLSIRYFAHILLFTLLFFPFPSNAARSIDGGDSFGSAKTIDIGQDYTVYGGFNGIDHKNDFYKFTIPIDKSEFVVVIDNNFSSSANIEFTAYGPGTSPTIDEVQIDKEDRHTFNYDSRLPHKYPNGPFESETYYIHFFNRGSTSPENPYSFTVYIREPVVENVDIDRTLNGSPQSDDINESTSTTVFYFDKSTTYDIEISGEYVFENNYQLFVNGSLREESGPTWDSYWEFDDLSYEGDIKATLKSSTNHISFEMQRNLINIPPTVRITSGPEEGQTIETKTVTFSWSGLDLDGHVIGYEFGMDGAGTPTNETSLTFNLPEGSHTFQVRAKDNEGAYSEWAIRRFTIDINFDPVAVDDTATTSEDTSISIDVLRNDSDPDDDPINISNQTDPQHGTINKNSDNTLTYAPSPNYHGSDTFTYTISDGKGGTDNATVSVTINSINDPPTATITSGPAEGEMMDTTTVTFGWSGSDTDGQINGYEYKMDGAATSTDETSHTFHNLRKGNHTFQVRAFDDENAYSEWVTRRFTVTVNTAPTIIITSGPTEGEVIESTTVSFTWLGSDPDDDGLFHILMVGINFGSVTGYEYMMDGVKAPTTETSHTFHDLSEGDHTFQVRAFDDENAYSEWAIRHFTIDVNYPPVAGVDSDTTDEDTSVTIIVLANDTDVEEDPLTVESTTIPEHGTVVINADYSVTYTPSANYSGPDSLTYIVTDGDSTDIGTVSLTINPINDAPVLDSSGDLVLTLVRENVTDPLGDSVPSILASAGGDPISDIDADAFKGIAVVGVDNQQGQWEYSNGEGSNWYQFGTPGETEARLLTNLYRIRFVPLPDYHGTVVDGLIFRAWDQTSGEEGGTANIGIPGAASAFSTAVETVSVTVIPNNPPVAVEDSSTVDEDSSVLIYVLENDTDADEDQLTVTDLTDPQHGEATNNGDGTVTYTPAADYNGTDTFTYIVSDSSDTDTEIVNVTIHPIPDPPVAVEDSVYTNEDTLVSIAVLLNDTDVDEDQLTVTNITDPQHGEATNNGDGTVTYTPAADYNGPDTFTYIVSDGDSTDIGTVDVTIRPIPDFPVAVDDSITVDEDGEGVPISVLENDIDVDGDPLSVTIATFPLHGSAIVNADSTVTYTPSGNYNGPDSLTYTINDGNGGEATATVGITINPVNDAPVLDSSVVLVLESVLEDVTDPSGRSVVSMLSNTGDPITDIDEGAVEGIAVVAVNKTHGAWQFSHDGGTTWANFDNPSKTGARLLASDARTKLRFVPTKNFNGTVTDGLTFHAWDQSSGSSGAMVDLSATGGTTPFSTATAGISITVTPVNDAPVLDNSIALILPSVLEDMKEPSGNDVVSILASTGDDPITDVDVGALEGIAVVSVDNTDGAWQYSSDEGSTWENFNSPSTTTAHLLGTTHKLRFVPATDYSGTIADGLHFHAWDRTSGSAGETADLSTTGGTTPFSEASTGISITITPVNDPPVAVNDSTTIQEDMSVTIPVLTNDSDVDGDPLRVTIAPEPSHGSAIVNADSTTVAYSPSDHYNGSDSFGYIIDDGQGGRDTTTVDITISSTNDAPILDSSVALSLDSESEDVIAPAGKSVQLMLANAGDPITDVDDGAIEGIAVVAVDNTHGEWQYSTDGGSTWAPFDTSSKTMARLLAADERTRLRFKPTRDFHGTVTDGLLFRAWDQTSGSAGAIADLSATGDTTPFSTDSAGVSITVISVNDAPVLDGSVAFALPSMLEDATEPLGQSVVALLDSAGGDPITDVDDAAEGIAVVAANDDHGKWQYSTNGGSSWLRFGNPSITMARLLAADADTRLRFVPAADYSGTVTDGLLFHAWDQTSGSAGAVADLSAIGDTTPFSTASAEISITVDPVNSAPSFTGGEDRVVDEDAGPQILETWVKDISPGPANESDQSVYFTIVNDSTELFLDPPSITPEGTLTYTTAENAYGKATLAIRLHDDGGTDNGGIDSSAAHTFAITINSVNDAPKLDSNIAMVLPSAWEDSEDLPEDDVASILASTDGDPITDVDADAVEGIAVVAVDNTNGAWQFSTNGGNTWTSFDRPRETSARLLASDERTKLRFKPDPDYSGTVSNGIIFHAWDQTSGVSGATANLNAIGKATPFSVRLAGISVTVNPINDPPSFTGGKSQVVNEDAGPKKISEWAMDISPGPDSESDQIVYFTIVSDSTELFLEPPSITREGTLTYTTAENAYGSGTLTVRLHDDGDTENGGIDSSAAQTFTITIQPVNDAPHLSNLSPPKPYTEDGPPVVLAPDGTINDVELDSKKDGAGNYNGATLYLECQNDTIQHSLSSNSVSDLQPLDQGKNLMIGTKTIGMVENNSDGLLELIFNDSATTSLVSYVIRNITYSTTHQSPPENVVIDFRLNDGNKGDQGEGGEKTGSEVITLALINLPDPPVLDITFSPKLASVPEDSTNNKGNSVAEIIVNGSISDADGVVEAMAVVSVDNSDGQWQYSTDDGRFWHSFTEEKGRKVNLSDKARLLDSIHKIRFVPDAHFHGDAIFTFRAWDQSSGIAGLTADLSSGTGMTSFSSAKDDATIKVLSVNDPPEFTCCEEDLSVEPGQQLSLTLSAMDVDGDPLLYSVEGEPDGSFLRDSTFTWSPTLEQIGNFFPTFTVEDTAGGWDTQDVTISVFEPPTPDLGQITYNPRQPRTEVPLEIVISGEFPASNAKISKQSFSREDDSIFIEFKTAWKGNITQPADEIATPWSVEGNVGSFEVGFYNVEVKANGKEYLTDFFPVLCPTCNESWILMDLDPSQGDQGDRRGAGAIINGKEYEIQLIKTSGEKIRGWSAVLRYDPHQLNYVTGSFQPSSYIPGLEKLIKEEWGKVTLGGTPLGSSEFGSGPGDLGTLSFEVLEGFQDSTIIMMTQNILYDDDGFIPFDDIFTSVTITSEITKKCGCIPDDFICLCDFDGNGEVGFEDFFLFADRFGLKEGEECEESPCYDYCYDLDEDGEIGFGDFFIFADCFGNDERPKLLALASEHLGLPLSPLLEQNFPNPFNASTTIRYIIGEEGIVQLRIFDLTGQIIRDLVTETQAPGIYQVVWDGKDNEGRLVANGMYIGELRIRNFSETIKMVLLQ